MPVDKFGHTDSGSIQRVIAGVVTLTQVNNTFVRRDGTNPFVGNLDIGGNSIEGLSMTYTPTEDNHLTTKRYVDRRVASNATRDYVSSMKVYPGNLVRNTTSGIIYRFEGTAGPITTAPALSPNWRPTTGAAICVLREGPNSCSLVVEAESSGSGRMYNSIDTIVINTDSAYRKGTGIIVPRTGVYRLSGFVSFDFNGTPRPIGSFICVKYTTTTNRTELEAYRTQIGVSGTSRNVTVLLPNPIVSFVGGEQIYFYIESNVSCSTTSSEAGASRPGSGLQVEFLY